MAFDQFIDLKPVDAGMTPKMTDDEYVDFVAEQSFPCSDPPPYYGGYRKTTDDLTPY